MNKKLTFILLIFTLFISFMINTGKVYAAKELTCTYSGFGYVGSVMLTQSSDGNKNLLIENSDNENDSWLLITKQNLGQIDLNIFNDKGNPVPMDNLDKCPEELTTIAFSSTAVEARFKKKYEEDKFYNDRVQQYETRRGLLKEEKYDILSKLTKECKSTTITIKYGKYNDKNFIIGVPAGGGYFPINPNVTAYQSVKHNRFEFSADEYVKFVEKYGCPILTYTTKVDHNSTTYIDWSLKNNGTPATQPEIGVGEADGKDEDKPPKVEVNSCKDLFDDDLRKDINSVMNILKIAVPLLIIGLGIADFSKAVFLNDESKMKEEQKRFIKRLVAGIIFFFIPILVNLLLTLTNKVWKNINPETCIGEEVK